MKKSDYTFGQYQDMVNIKGTYEQYIQWKNGGHKKEKSSRDKNVQSKKPTNRGMLDVRIPFRLIDNEDWIRQNKNDTTLYLVLRSYIVRGPDPKDPFDLYNRYYMDNKLVTSVGVEFLADLFGYTNHRHICRMLDRLEAKGAFEVETIPLPPPLKPKKIYILGECIQGVEIYKWGGPVTNQSKSL